LSNPSTYPLYPNPQNKILKPIFSKQSLPKNTLLLTLTSYISHPTSINSSPLPLSLFTITHFLITFSGVSKVSNSKDMDKEDRDYEEEENSGSESMGDEPQHQRKPHMGGRIIREEPSNIREL